jgi:hypothetical protein
MNITVLAGVHSYLTAGLFYVATNGTEIPSLSQNLTWINESASKLTYQGLVL